jgi:hypothetical protein
MSCQVKEDKMSGAYVRMGEKTNAYRLQVGIPELQKERDH